MKQTYSLKIENPCQQDWSLMDQNETGKYCHQCEKEVIDFTHLNEKQIIQTIQKNKGKLCGRLTNEQLEQSFVFQKSSKSTSFYKLLAGLLLFGTAKISLASNKTSSPIAIVSAKHNFNSKELFKEKTVLTDSTKNIIQGRVIDSLTKETLIGASIMLKNTKLATFTNLDGNFKLTVPDSLINDTITLIFNSLGYEKKETIIHQNELPILNTILVVPALNNITLGAVIILKKKKWYQFWKQKHH